MKEKNIHKMKLDFEPFLAIRWGSKRFELRLNDEKRKKIKEGDIIEFTCNKNCEKINAKVLSIQHFKNFEQLYKKIDKVELGYSLNQIASAEDMLKYYSQEQQEKDGVLAIEIRVLRE